MTRPTPPDHLEAVAVASRAFDDACTASSAARDAFEYACRDRDASARYLADRLADDLGVDPTAVDLYREARQAVTDTRDATRAATDVVAARHAVLQDARRDLRASQETPR